MESLTTASKIEEQEGNDECWDLSVTSRSHIVTRSIGLPL